MFFERIGNEDSEIRLIWLHGWGVDHTSLSYIASSFSQYDNYLLDLAGFGKTKEPTEAWDTLDYAKSVNNFIESLTQKKTIVLGHSFGGRVCIQLASNCFKEVSGIVLIGGAGLQKKRSIFFKIYMFLIKTFGPMLKKIFPFLSKIKVGSSDYKKTSGTMREIIKKTLSENLENISQNIKIPTLLIYGSNDTATPPCFGETYNKNIKNSKLFVIPNADHYSLLQEHSKQTQYFIINFLKENFL